MKRITLLTSTAVLLASLALAAAPAAYAQDPGAHNDEHHPAEQAAPQAAQPATPPAQQGPGGMMGMMSPEMMQRMMGGGTPMMSGMMGRSMMQPAPGITIIINTHDMSGMMGSAAGQTTSGGSMGSGMVDHDVTMGQQGIAYRKTAMTMLQAMNMPLTGDPDVDFARMMIPHHRGAIDMARSQLENGKAPELREMAQDVIEAQEQEITMLQEWLTNHPQ